MLRIYSFLFGSTFDNIGNRKIDVASLNGRVKDKISAIINEYTILKQKNKLDHPINNNLVKEYELMMAEFPRLNQMYNIINI
mgnify:FL=1